MVRWSLLSKHIMGVSNKAGVHGALYGLGGVIPLVGFRGNTPKTPIILRYLKSYNI